ncbi:MAG TPA: prephenate dehydratase [Burkholderiales bacterium]|nr:prephenate dehydratase [Burkholderiales bacterium]
MADELAKIRAQIDALDDRILKLVNRRASLAQRVGRVKNGPAYRPEREAQVLRRMRGANPGPLPAEAVGRLFGEIMSACRALEEPLSVAFLGPRGTYSEEAAVKQFGAGAQVNACASIDEVFRVVEAGSVDYGVVPVENSTEGAVGRTLDLLLSTPLTICGEVLLPVHQCLMSKRGPRRPPARIFSHTQSLAQCRGWLNQRYPDAERVAVVSNAEAARMASRDARSAAIAGRGAAALYALKIVAANIEDEPNNTTRFVVIGKYRAAPSGRDRSSLVLSTPNRPGAVHALLTPLASHGVSMTRLESRPARASLWEYVFFVDIEGHQDDERVAQALAEMREKASFLKVLGSYPAAL